MCMDSRKYPCQPQGRALEILRERGFSKAIFKGKYETLLKFPWGWGAQPKKSSFWNHTIQRSIGFKEFLTLVVTARSTTETLQDLTIQKKTIFKLLVVFTQGIKFVYSPSSAML